MTTRQLWKPEVENALLGSMIVWGILPSTTWLNPDSFYFPDNRLIFESMMGIEADGNSVDLVTIRSKLESQWNLIKAGGQKRILEIADGIYTTTNIQSYIKDIKKESRRISTLSKLEEIRTKGYDDKMDEGEVFELASQIIANVWDEGADWCTVDEGKIGELYHYLWERQGKDLFGYSFGPQFSFIDKMTMGVQPRRTYRLGAPSNVGKTQISYSWINSFLAQWAKVAFFTLENERNLTLTNLMANYKKVNSRSIERGESLPDAGYLSSLKNRLYIIDDVWELGDIFSKCISIKPDIVILDYIWLSSIKGLPADSHYDEYAKRVQRFVKRTGCAWIDLSNLPKSQEDEETIRSFGGFHGSSFLKNNTDVGIHLCYWTPFFKYKDVIKGTPLYEKYLNKQMLQLMITKNRLGPAKVEQVYKVDYDKGADWNELDDATKEDVLKSF